jgi:hypothetical protein
VYHCTHHHHHHVTDSSHGTTLVTVYHCTVHTLHGMPCDSSCLGAHGVQIAQVSLQQLTRGSTAQRVHLMAKSAAEPAAVALQEMSVLYVLLGSTPSSAAAVHPHTLDVIKMIGAVVSRGDLRFRARQHHDRLQAAGYECRHAILRHRRERQVLRWMGSGTCSVIRQGRWLLPPMPW